MLPGRRSLPNKQSGSSTGDDSALGAVAALQTLGSDSQTVCGRWSVTASYGTGCGWCCQWSALARFAHSDKCRHADRQCQTAGWGSLPVVVLCLQASWMLKVLFFFSFFFLLLLFVYTAKNVHLIYYIIFICTHYILYVWVPQAFVYGKQIALCVSMCPCMGFNLLHEMWQVERGLFSPSCSSLCKTG